MDNIDDLKIRLYGDPVLRKKAEVITKIDDQLRRLVQNMTQTMYEAQGVGLAAPQVGVSKRLVVIDVGEGPMAFVNPKIISLEGEKESGVEGCLSVPGIIGDVIRNSKVTVQAVNIEGKTVMVEGEGLLARAFQHEIDHLDGVLFVDKATDLRSAQIEENEN